MIDKVKPPASAVPIRSSPEAKNDLGGQAGNAYSGPSDQRSDREAGSDSRSEESHLKLVHSSDAPSEPDPAHIQDQIGLTQVVKEWMESAPQSQNLSAQSLTQKYQGESAPAKGILLNKKT